MAIPRLDARPSSSGEAVSLGEAVATLRRKLSPAGDVVSEAGRRRTQAVFGEPLTPVEVIERICGDVRKLGVAAVCDYSARIDGSLLSPQELRVPEAELAAAHASVGSPFLQCIRRVRDNIWAFQQALLHQDAELPLAGGGYLRQRYRPLDRVGVCVPGGAASYPSTVLMTVVPARAAGVQQIAVVAPPTPFGAYNQHLLATCHELGVTEVYRLGGAQGVAALAYGVEGIGQVDKIVGPGNLFVALAKKHVYGEVDIDSIAGPSEVLVVADDSADARFIAADMLAQAEHSPGASILVTWLPHLLDQVALELERQLAPLSRSDLARTALDEFGALILVRDRAQAADIANMIAPEHLHLAVDSPAELLERITHVGAAFLGNHSPVAAGDYAAGPSHVLPTSGTARFASGLCANDFLRRTSVIHLTPEDLSRLAPDIIELATVEGLSAHRASVECRLPNRGSAGGTDRP